MTNIELKNINDKTKVSEKMIQKAVLDFLELNLKEKIDSEEFSEIKDYQEHTYLILKDLKKAIKNLNQNLFNEYSNKINEDQLLTLLLNDFVSKFNACKTNVDIYNLIFIMENRQCSLKILGIDKSIYYNVLDLDNLNSNNNELRIIREKRIKDSFFKELELPDFAIYINGLPFFVIELKTSDMDRTYKAAIKDYKKKKSYQHFLGCICSDVENTIILTGQKNKEYLWLNYGKHIVEDSNSLIDVLNELVLKKENILFYMKYACKIKGSENKYIQSARIQQYFVAKEYFKIFKESKILKDNNQSIKNKTHFKHHTRTGKTFSINLIINLLSNKFNNLYNKVFILAHDLTVLNNFEKEFKGELFGSYGEVKVIKSKEDYLQIIKSLKHNTNKEIYLMNIQKMDLPKKSIDEDGKTIMNVNSMYDKEDILFIIDEVHTHQNLEDGYAYVRNGSFPNASYITTTATPEMKEISKGKFQNITKEIFGLEVDNFTPNDAVRLKIVTKLEYKKFLWTSKVDKDEEYNNLMKQVKLLDQNVRLEAHKRLLEDDSKLEKLCKDMANQFYGNDNFFKTSKENIFEYLTELLIENYDYENKFLNDEKVYIELYGKENVEKIIKIYRDKFENAKQSTYETIKTQLENDLKKSLITEKIDIIVKDMEVLKTISNYNFTPKAFWVVSSVKEGIDIISKLKEKISNEEDKKQNIYKNYRFALDVSKFDYDDYEFDEEDTKTLENNISNLNELNGKYVKESSNLKKRSHALVDFETETKGSIDILIIVGKYLMGYDLDRLVKVYIDTNINDYKRIIQIATRGSTIREGKEISFVLDLNLNRDTQTLFSEALKLYNGDDGYQEFMLDEDIIKEKLEVLDVELNKITNFFFNQIKLLKEENIITFNELDKHNIDKSVLINKNLINTFVFILILVSDYLSKDIENKNKNIDYNEYWQSVKIINKILKELTIPEYFISENSDVNYLEYIETLMKINGIYFKKILNKESLGIERLSEHEIKNIIKDTFKLLSKDFDTQIDSINDILKISNEKNLQTTELEKVDNGYISSLLSLQTTLAKQHENGTIIERISQYIQFCMTNKEKDKNEEKDIFKELENMKIKQNIFIKEKCESDLNIFIIYQELREKLNELKLILDERIVINFSKLINNIIVNMLNNNNYHKVINKNEWIENEEKLEELSKELFDKISDIDRVFKALSKEDFNELRDFYNYLILDIKTSNKSDYKKQILNKMFINIFDKQRIYSDKVFHDFYS